MSATEHGKNSRRLIQRDQAKSRPGRAVGGACEFYGKMFPLRVPRNIHAPPTLPGTLSTAGHDGHLVELKEETKKEAAGDGQEVSGATG